MMKNLIYSRREKIKVEVHSDMRVSVQSNSGHVFELTGIYGYIYCLIDGNRTPAEILNDLQRWRKSGSKELSHFVPEALEQLYELGLVKRIRR